MRKLYNMLMKESLKGAIAWSDEGTSFEVHQREQFIQVILPRYFKHQNMNSFIRQLNMYDFKKNKRSIYEIKFSHPFFQREHPELLGQIKRQTNSSYVSVTTRKQPYMQQLPEHLRIRHEMLMLEGDQGSVNN